MTSIIEESRFLPRIVLIACGSFSPPTPMHFRMFEIAKDHFDIAGTHKVIGGIVSPTHDSYGKKGLVPAKHRCAMVKLALQTSSWIRMSDWETKQSQWSRTRQVLKYHQNFMNNYINSPNDCINEQIPSWLPPGLEKQRDMVQLKLLCGADLLESFAVPGLWSDEDIEDIISNHGLVVITRSGSNPEKFIFDSDILTKLQSNITLVTNWVPNEVSSTMIRRLLSRGQSVKYLIDDKVIEYIKRLALFNYKTKHINQLTWQSKDIHNPQYINQVNVMNSLNNSQGGTSDNNANNIVDDCVPIQDDDEEEMDETDYTVKNILSCNLDNRRSTVFCCGENGEQVSSKLLPQRNGPGQAVQVITTERGQGQIQRITEREEMKPKKMRISAPQNV